MSLPTGILRVQEINMIGNQEMEQKKINKARFKVLKQLCLVDILVSIDTEAMLWCFHSVHSSIL